MISVFKAFSIIEGDLIGEPLPNRSGFKAGDVATVLIALDHRGGPMWSLTLHVTGRPNDLRIPLKAVVSADEYERSCAAPFPFSALGVELSGEKFSDPTLRWLWLYRDGIYVTERSPRPSEMDEVVLRIKALHFQNDKAMRRLSEQVANFEAVEGQLRAGRQGREPIPDDVKLLVWARDGGVCVRCGSAKELHFDHIIPLARGGGNTAENLQLLCRPCNQAKGDRLV